MEVKGMLPLGRLPLWGREGVILIISKEHQQNDEYKKGFLQSPEMLNLFAPPCLGEALRRGKITSQIYF